MSSGAAATGPEVVLIAMVAANGVIGDGDDQPWHLREDQRRFRALTLGHPVVMGRATYAAMGRPLPGRSNVVLTRDPAWSADGVTVAHGLAEALHRAAALPGGDQIWVIGGGRVYADALALASRIELTEVDAEAVGDARFPDLDPARWVETARDDRAALAYVSYARADEPADD